MSYNVKKLADHLAIILANTTADRDRVDDAKPHSILGGAGSAIEVATEAGKKFTGKVSDEGPPTIYVLEAGLRAENEFVNECLKDREIASQIGDEALRARLRELLRRIHDKSEQPASLESVVKNEILKPLRAEIKTWCVRLPIVNLRLTSPLQLGRVTFLRHDDGVVANTRAIMGFEGAPDVLRSNSDKAGLLKVVAEIGRISSAWAEVEIQSHEGRIRHVAHEQVEAVVNAVRAFTRLFSSRQLRAAFGLPYELTALKTGAIAVSESRISIHTSLGGAFTPFAFTDDVHTCLKENCYLDSLVRIASENWSALNSLERAVRVACHWVGRSVIASTDADAFTRCTIALERLLVTDGEDTTVDRFADRLAYLLSDNAKERNYIHRAAKRLYNVRSNIVHAGFVSVAPTQLDEIENLAIGALVKVASLLDELPDHNALRALFHDRKMA